MSETPQPPPDARLCPFRTSHNCLAHFTHYGELRQHLATTHRGEWPGNASGRIHTAPWQDAWISHELHDLATDDLDALLSALANDAAKAHQAGLLIPPKEPPHAPA
jgi:hypothetical protein